MRKFLAGVAVGLAIGGATTALAAELVGRNGFLMGYVVTINGDVVCYDPWVWAGSIREIECTV